MDDIFAQFVFEVAIENYRVEQRTDYEKLIIELDCDGSITPKDALQGLADSNPPLHAIF